MCLWGVEPMLHLGSTKLMLGLWGHLGRIKQIIIKQILSRQVDFERVFAITTGLNWVYAGECWATTECKLESF